MLSEQAIQELDKDLSPLLIKTRKGASGSNLDYLEGHTVIDQANRIFIYGQWGYRILSCKPSTIIDPATGEAIGVVYEAEAELVVDGCMPVSDIGQQAVSAWNVQDVVLSRRGKDGDKEAPIQAWERQIAQRIIVDAHEVARKGAATDALKRCLRTFGPQFGNSLYGEGRVILVDGDSLIESELKAEWAKVYHIKDTEVESRWPKFKVFALQEVVKELSADHKVKLYTTIQQQLKKSA